MRVSALWDVRVDELSLSRLALEAPEPAAKQSRDLQRSLHGLADEIDAVTDENRRLAEGGLGDVHSLLDTVVGSTTGDIFTQMGRRHRARASLDGRARVTGAAAGFATARAELVGNTEDLLGEPDAGVQQALLGVFDAPGRRAQP